MDKLIKQLKREFKKNPKKVFLLGGLFLICLWVVYPLVFPPVEVKPVRKNPAVAETTSTTTQVAPASGVVWRWQDLDRALANDPRMRSAPGLDDLGELTNRNPFETEFDVDAALDEYLADAEAEMTAEAEASTDLARQDAADPNRQLFDAMPLELSGTLVGAGVRSAVVNGRPYAEGASIGSALGVPLTLAKVGPRSVVVRWKDMERTLRILRASELPGLAPPGGVATAH